MPIPEPGAGSVSMEGEGRTQSVNRAETASTRGKRRVNLSVGSFTSHTYTYMCIVGTDKEYRLLPWLVRLSGLSASLQTKGSPVQFPVRAHAWVAGQVPSRGRMGGNQTVMFLSLSSSLPPV